MIKLSSAAVTDSIMVAEKFPKNEPRSAHPLSKERPIIFSGEMVRAILEGRKTQTRRVMKGKYKFGSWLGDNCPYGRPGDRLWVREIWAQILKSGDCVGDEYDPCDFQKCGGCQIEYKADTDNPYPAEWDEAAAREEADAPRWKPSIHMPRWASRITLEITNIRIERVQEISEQDVEREGTQNYSKVPSGVSRTDYQYLWDSINAKRGFGWDINPWVWVLEFKRVSN